MKTELCELFEKYLADKTNWNGRGHTYSSEYYNLFKDLKEKKLKILEIGIGTRNHMVSIVGEEYKPGASLRAWRDFFINSQIYAFDIDKNIVFEEERIKCFQGDQSTNTELQNVLQKMFVFNGDEFKFDIIIDDGSHELNHQVTSLLFFLKHLKENGIYIVEDVRASNIQHFENLDVPNASITYIHKGENEWDNFVVYKPTN
jgi:hypothetical protein